MDEIQAILAETDHNFYLKKCIGEYMCQNPPSPSKLKVREESPLNLL